jgi:hypothetical protein
MWTYSESVLVQLLVVCRIITLGDSNLPNVLFLFRVEERIMEMQVKELN